MALGRRGGTDIVDGLIDERQRERFAPVQHLDEPFVRGIARGIHDAAEQDHLSGLQAVALLSAQRQVQFLHQSTSLA